MRPKSSYRCKPWESEERQPRKPELHHAACANVAPLSANHGSAPYVSAVREVEEALAAMPHVGYREGPSIPTITQITNRPYSLSRNRAPKPVQSFHSTVTAASSNTLDTVTDNGSYSAPTSSSNAISIGRRSNRVSGVVRAPFLAQAAVKIFVFVARQRVVAFRASNLCGLGGD